jgi:hypothetical protein
MVSYHVQTPEAYLTSIPEERRPIIAHVRQLILDNLPKGYVETVNWGMLSYEIPLEVFPNTYNKQPLSYVGLAAQKHKNPLYLMAVYTSPEAYQSLLDAYAAEGLKPDLGKGCLRFCKPEDLPLEKVAELIRFRTPEEYIEMYLQSRRDQR